MIIHTTDKKRDYDTASPSDICALMQKLKIENIKFYCVAYSEDDLKEAYSFKVNKRQYTKKGIYMHDLKNKNVLHIDNFLFSLSNENLVFSSIIR